VYAEALGTDFAAAAGCDEPETVPACLRAKTAEELLLAVPPRSGLFFGQGMSWGPNVDGVVLPDFPAVALGSGDFDPVPLLLGSNRDEGTLFIALAELGDIDEAQYAEIIAEIAIMFFKQADDILAAYPASDYDSPAAALAAVLGEAMFNCPARAVARAVSVQGPSAYLYHFVREGDFPLYADLGAFHSAELPFVFGTPVFGVELAAEDEPLSEAIMGYWTRFAASGDPNGDGEVDWPGYQQASDQHLELGLSISSGSGLRADACDFWAAP